MYAQPLYSPSNQYLSLELLTSDSQAGKPVVFRAHSTSELSGNLHIMAVSRGNIIHDLDATITPRKDTKKVVDISFVLLPAMTPELDLLAYTIFNETEMVADSIEIISKPTFENKVGIAFKDGQRSENRPGENTSLEMFATPGSLCAISVVDRSVHLLAGNNQLQSSSVEGFVNRFQLSNGYDPNRPCQNQSPDKNPGPFPIEEPLIARPVLLARRKKRQFNFFPIYSGLVPKYSDVTKELQQLGLVYLTNLEIETSPCHQPYFFRSAFASAAVAEDVQFARSAVAAGGADGSVIRTYFPETWLWSLHRISEESGTADLSVTVPDTITTWEGSGFCVSTRTGFGISEPFSLKATKPFFAEYILPYSVIRYEIVELKINVFYYHETETSKCLPIKVALVTTDKFNLTEGDSVQRACVCGNSEPAQVIYDIQPLTIGEIDIETTVEVIEGASGVCGQQPVNDDITFRDGLRKTLLVEAEGEEIQDTFSAYFCPSENDNCVYEHDLSVKVPRNYVADSGRVIIHLSGDLMSASLSNIDQLLRMPYGCGEQNMIGFVPNIFALQYLESSGQATPAHYIKGRRNMRKGYQSQLKYRLTIKGYLGSYSAFGNSDKKGSAWLTAYVVRSFAQASRFITVDKADLDISIAWLKTLQDRSGCFRTSGRVIHKEMQGGVNDGKSLTAFILVSFLEAGVDVQDSSIQGALRCVAGDISSITDTYAAALIAYGLSVANDSRTAVVLQLLESRAKNEGGVKWWESNRVTKPSNSYRHVARAAALNVEMTSYILLTYVNQYKSEAVARGAPLAKWLTSQQNARGGFYSSQDTVVAIHALATYATLIFGKGSSVAMSIHTNPGQIFQTLMTVTEENRLVQQRRDLADYPQAIKFRAVGGGCALLSVTMRYNIHPSPPETAPFALRYHVTGDGGPGSCTNVFTIHICVSYLGDDKESNMALVELKMISGFAPKAKAGGSPVKGISGETIKRIEEGENKQVIYYEKLTSKETCFDVDIYKAFKVTRTQPGLITVYDYYDTGLSEAQEYTLENCTTLESLAQPPLLEEAPSPAGVQLLPLNVN
ncbi:pregnancy zone protein-like [Diadema setosum]|uniref:pregnancy zone protein-like n=1 Tax=Diadema setosum TaxID=31175 RepID=UPI003B3AF146